MKKVHALLIAGVLMAGCSKEQTISDHPFTIEFPTIEYNQSWVDIVPENNDFRYNVGILSVEEFNSYGSISDAIKIIHANSQKEYKQIQSEYAEWDIEIGSFEDAMLFQGAAFRCFCDLEPRQSYVLIAYVCDNDGNPATQYEKNGFTTAEYIPSDISFSASLSGELLTITPTNNDTYFCDMVTKKTIDKEYEGSVELFYLEDVIYYCSYGFTGTVMNRTGVTSGNILEYLDDLEVGDKFYLIASGYSHGVNSDTSCFEITYNGPGREGTVVKYIYGLD